MILYDLSISIVLVMIFFAASIGWSAAKFSSYKEDCFEKTCEDEIEESCGPCIHINGNHNEESRIERKEEDREGNARDESGEITQRI